MLTRKTLQRINERPKQVNRLPLALIGAGSVVLAALLAVLTSSLLLALVALLAGAVGILLAHRARRAAGITSLTYDNLSSEVKARFLAVQEGCEALSSSQEIWRLSGPAQQRASKTGDAFLPPVRKPARAGLLETPGIRANVPIWGIDAYDELLFFFPEAVLIYRNERYEGVPYEALEVAISSARFYEKAAVPEDAQVVAERTARSRMPVVLYGLLEVGLPRDLGFSLQVSSRDAAARFARAFGVEETGRTREREEDAGETRAFHEHLSMKERARIASAFTTLGVRKGASMAEITAAYKKLARAHHPDKVATLEPEERELSERRMKEINAAYTELKFFLRNFS